MLRIFRHYVPRSLLFIAILDFGLLLAAVYTSAFLLGANGPDPLRVFLDRATEALVFATTLITAMFSVGLYQSPLGQGRSVVVSRIVIAFLIGLLAIAPLYYLAPEVSIGRSDFVISVGFGFAGIVLFRLLHDRVGEFEPVRRRILVLGIGERAAKIQRLEETRGGRRFECVGYVPLGESGSQIDAGSRILGNRSLAEVAATEGIEEIVVALDERRGSLPVKALLDCKLNGIAITDYSSFWERETCKMDLDALHPSWLIFSDGFVGGSVQMTVKRLFDLAASLAMMVWTLPLLIVAAVAIKLDSAGTIFFRQERVGRNGAPFNLIKFRSMRSDAEKDGVPRWADVNDSRITRVGNLIRKTRIDEIPQILNVLRGEMSLIGPRPERPYFVSKLEEIIPYYGERHRVKPGISGWAQLNYPYGASTEDAKEKFQYDLYYIKNYSLFLDLIVLVQTVRVVLWPVGAR
jgi:sugar transferase (PEP-CTERM system associated)